MRLEHIFLLIVVAAVQMHASTSFRTRITQNREATIVPLSRFLLSVVEECGIGLVETLHIAYLWIVVVAIEEEDGALRVAYNSLAPDADDLLTSVADLRTKLANTEILHFYPLTVNEGSPRETHSVALSASERHIVICATPSW